jgi:hypothetical protein
MKNILFIGTSLLALTILFITCKNTRTNTKEYPFDASFTGIYVSVAPDSARCGSLPWVQVINEGQGEDEHIGQFRHYFSFCAHIDSGFYPGEQMIAYLVDHEGDSVFIACAGRVVEGRMEDHPEHVVSYWRDPFEILGGTGKFMGASGKGFTDDYNSRLDTNSHHNWKGTITLLSGM